MKIESVPPPSRAISLASCTVDPPAHTPCSTPRSQDGARVTPTCRVKLGKHNRREARHEELEYDNEQVVNALLECESEKHRERAIALERTRLRQGTSGRVWIDMVEWKTSGCAQMDTFRSETSDRARKDLMEVGPSSCTELTRLGTETSRSGSKGPGAGGR